MRKTLLAVSLGGAFEMYDFVCYTLLASIIAPQFFPRENHKLSLLLTYAVFAIGYFARPLGGLIYGHFGDKLGRKNTLIFSILMMAVPSFILGLLPTYQMIGIAAPLLLILLRMLQGLAVGGDFPGAIVFISEHGALQYLNRNNAWVFSGVNVGVMLATGLCALLSSIFSAQQWHDYVWRLPFLSGVLIALVGIHYRQKLAETPVFLQLAVERRRLRAPISHLVTKYWKNILSGIASVAMPATVVSIVSLFMPTYLHVYLYLTLHQAFLMSTLNLLVLVLLVPFAGMVADRIGLHRALLICALFFIVLSWPLYYLLVYFLLWLKLIPLFLLSIGMSMAVATMGPSVFALFPAEVRYSGVGVAYNLALAIFGGTAPFFATWLLNSSRSPVIICICLIITGAISLASVLWRKVLLPQA